MRNVIEIGKILVCFLTLTFAAFADANEFSVKYLVKPVSVDQAEEYGLETSYYKKSVEVQGILIATSEKVFDHALREAAYQFDLIMQSINVKVAQRIRDRKVLCILVGYQELTSNVPQFPTKKVGKELDFYNWRRRGFLTTINKRPTVLFAEEDVLEYEGGMRLESILIHEFGHVIHGAGFDDELQNRLTDAFQKARAGGIWKDGRAAQRFRRVKSATPVSLLRALIESFPEQSPELIKNSLDGGDILVNGKPTNSKAKVTQQDKVLIVFGGEKECYAHKNRAEYWAEGVQCWYDTNRIMDHDHNHIHTREQLKEYDRPLAQLCKDVLGEADWRFVSPRKRAGADHLTGFDPTRSPVAKDPPHIADAANDYYDEYWKDYWQRLQKKHSMAKTSRLNADAKQLWIIDPHTHFKGREQVALEIKRKKRDPRDTLGKVILPEDYRAVANRLGIQSTMVVEAVEQEHPQFNTWMIKQAESDLVCGYVARGDLASDEFLNTYHQYRQSGFLKGYRFRFDELNGYLQNTKARRHLSVLENDGMVVDLLIEHPHAKDAIRLAQEYPQLKIVINHCFRARMQNGKISDEWRQAVKCCAKYPNVFCKVSSILNFSETAPFTDPAPTELKAYLPVLQTCFDAFGEDRVIFATNWGVCTHFGTVEDVVRIVTEFLQSKSEAALKKGMRENAIRVYGISSKHLRDI